MTSVEILCLLHGVEVDVPSFSHHPFTRSHVEVSGNLREEGAVGAADRGRDVGERALGPENSVKQESIM